jgi:tRNA A-37 threonylcarbamoyl transferase component Bud32
LLFVKVGRPGRRWARCRRWLLGGDAARERRIAEYATQHGIDAVSPVAVADAPINRRQPTSVFVTLGLPDARPLNESWESLDPRAPATRRLKNQIIDAVARLIATAHQNGLEHFDLHAGNVLIQPTPAGLHALFVDLNNIRIGRTIRDPGVVRNLAQFNQWFRAHAPLTDRLRFLDRYLHWYETLRPRSSHGRRLGCDRRELLRRLNAAALKHASALYAKRDRRIMKTGRYFARLALGDGWRAHMFLSSKHPVEGSPASALTLAPQQWKQWLGGPIALVTPTDRRQVIKESRSGLVCRGRLALGDGRTVEVICKRSQPRGLAKRILQSLRASRPMLAWKRGNALLHRQIPTARPLAVLERRRCGLLMDSLVISEYLPHTQDLDTLLTVALREQPANVQGRLKRQVADSLAGLIRRLHELGFTHRDLKAPNILVQWDPAWPQPARTLLVDMDGLRVIRRPTSDVENQALARLNVSLDHCKRVTLADRVRFLRFYLTRVGCPQPRWKPLWRQLAAASDAKRRARRRWQEKMLRKYGRF